MGDEGIGVHVVNHVRDLSLPDGVSILDGGTGSFQLLEPMQEADKVVLIDATLNGQSAGTVNLLRPKFTTDYPRTLTAHDIGLKDLLDAFHLLGNTPDVTLFAISIEEPEGLGTEISPDLKDKIPEIAQIVLSEVKRILSV